MGKRIKVYHFPPSALEVSQAKVQWESFRKAALNRLCEGAEKMQAPANAMLPGRGVPIVKMFDCLDR